MANNRKSRFVMVNGVKTHYTESSGDGPVVVAMHGGVGEHELDDLAGDADDRPRALIERLGLRR